MGSKWSWLWFVLMCVACYAAWYQYDQAANSQCATIMSNLEQLADDSKSFIEDKIDNW